jgi:hypothetical protein
MARLEIVNGEPERRVIVTLSRRNLLALLQKLDMDGSFRQIENNDCYEDGQRTPWDPGEELLSELAKTKLVLRSEDDAEHYASRPAAPGPMHPATETFIREKGGWSPCQG